jgi:hypothetical protein
MTSLSLIERSYLQRHYVSCPALDLDLLKDFHKTSYILSDHLNFF